MQQYDAAARPDVPNGGGTPLRESGNSPEAWLAVLPLYAELQRGEAVHRWFPVVLRRAVARTVG